MPNALLLLALLTAALGRAEAMPSALSPGDLFYGCEGLRAPLTQLQAEASKPRSHDRGHGVQVAVRVWPLPEASRRAMPSPATMAFAVDLDQDGKLDSILRDAEAGHTRVLMANGALGAAQALTPDPCPCTRFFADLDGDRWAEMLVDCGCAERWRVLRLGPDLAFKEVLSFVPGFVADGTAPSLPGLPLGPPWFGRLGGRTVVMGFSGANDFSEQSEDFAAVALPTLYFRSASKGSSQQRLSEAKRAEPLALGSLVKAKDELRWTEALRAPLQSSVLSRSGQGQRLSVELLQLGAGGDPWPDQPSEALVVRDAASKLVWWAPLDPAGRCCDSSRIRKGWLGPRTESAVILLDGQNGLELRHYSPKGLSTTVTTAPCPDLEAGLRWRAQGLAALDCAGSEARP